ncbi:glycine-rich cell wall structural protein 1.8 isoform X2 [Drosophila santomea]|uniref:glycine-rich cell wall structural protein 1.8 isoform X2 n=1 Tax=Drosophila santomea TaxID=129105 RepID=UPI001952A18F|nr:glycine-rich cell wall structural protein 1.8 isoform X2 [Drosophila santomea]
MLALPLLTLAVLASCGYTVDAYSKYGRGCGDIGCLPTEECVITSDSCSYNQRDGKDCGNYPTCKRRSGGGSSASNSSPNLAAPSANPSGSVLNPGYPMHGLQPVNPYNPPFIFGQLPFYGGGGPTGTGGPPGGVGGGGGNGGVGGGVGLPSSTLGILGGGGGGLAPYGSNYQGYQGYQSQHSNANMYNKPPPQYQNQNQQNPYNRRTQAHPSAAGSLGVLGLPLLIVGLLLALLPHT